MAHTTLTLYIATRAAEFEIEVDAEGDVSHGGSNSYGSDEPAWTEVDNVTLYRPGTTRPLPRRVLAALEATQSDYIAEMLIEAE